MELAYSFELLFDDPSLNKGFKKTIAVDVPLGLSSGTTFSYS
jgi:hypothetical protein